MRRLSFLSASSCTSCSASIGGLGRESPGEARLVPIGDQESEGGGIRDERERNDKQNNFFFFDPSTLGTLSGSHFSVLWTICAIRWRMSLWPLHLASTPRLTVVQGVPGVRTRTITHLRHLQTPAAYYSQTIVSYNFYLHYHHTRNYSTQQPQSVISPSSPLTQTTQAQQTPTALQSKQDDKSSVPVEPVPPLTTRIWTKVKHEASHYWHGTKLLASDIRISSRLLASLLRGKTLTRRERRQVRPISARHLASRSLCYLLSCSLGEVLYLAPRAILLKALILSHITVKASSTLR